MTEKDLLQLGEDVKLTLNDQKFSDCKIKVNDQIIYCHKMVLYQWFDLKIFSHPSSSLVLILKNY